MPLERGGRYAKAERLALTNPLLSWCSSAFLTILRPSTRNGGLRWSQGKSKDGSSSSVRLGITACRAVCSIP